MVTAEPVLRIHQAPGDRLWWGDDRRVAHDSGQDVDEFLGSGKMNEYARVRLLGDTCNAELIEKIHTLRKKSGLPTDQRIQIGSPVICKDTLDPTGALLAMWHWSVNQGLGGRWVELEDKDISSYSLIAELIRNEYQVNEKVRTIVRYHPAWPALSFIPSLNIDNACLLVAAIVDPRWFMHPTRPGRASKLYQFLGLTPKNIQHLLNDTGTSEVRGLGFAYLTTFSWVDKGLRKPSIGAPEWFLYRILGAFPGKTQGFLSANKKFVRLVREVWLQELTPDRQVFCPEAFFKYDEEREAYEKHCAQLKCV